MTRPRSRKLIGFAFATAILATLPAGAQISHPAGRPLAANIVIPQTRAFAIGQTAAVEIAEVDARVAIFGQVATTTMEISLVNPAPQRLEAELIVPVPEGAVVRGFAFEGSAQEPVAKLLPKEEARRIYDGLVARIRDPALLEFLGYNLIRSSVFPVEGRGTQKVRLTYDHLLPSDGTRVDYVLPRSESLDYRVPWNIDIRIESTEPISAVYSPSHRVVTERAGARDITAALAPGANLEAGPFRLSYLLEGDGVTASLIAYPDIKGDGGYFLLLAGTPAEPSRLSDGAAIKREVILVLDRSGSMSGEKIQQVRSAALQVISGLEDGETFNIIVYNGGVDLFASAPVVRSEAHLRMAREYLAAISAVGGTNIHEALLTALHQKPTPGALPIVLFLTDGLPTMGQTSEMAIRTAALDQNTDRRRIFTFGVGVDVNAPLLDKIAAETRGTSTFVLSGEDVETKISRQAAQLAGPVLAGPEIRIVAAGDRAQLTRVRDMIPAKLPDLFKGDQLVLLGRYTGDQPLDVKLTGNFLGEHRAFRYRFGLDNASTRNAFVPRLWASRKIATLVDAVRQMGAHDPRFTGDPRLAQDPRFRELVDEIVRLSTEFGILTEYTAFLAEEGTDLSSRETVLARAGENFHDRAIAIRSGNEAVAQSLNYKAQHSQKALNPSNSFVYVDKAGGRKNLPGGGNIRAGRRGNAEEPSAGEMARVTFTAVRQVSDRAFFRKQGQWVDSRILGNEAQAAPARTVTFGSAAFFKLALELTRAGRQGTIALKGDILLEIDGETVLIKTVAG